ncbi:hypothetical protein BDA96_03G426700 [Sorghum bicolor]|uniref:NET domain-containing protein n=2 Tax=Sorghum bicolor TaxID=4558 RepID=A0A921RHZ9_SORBI|nr:uncharacterized protein LOC8056143 [Sorghum bicolor]KAG0540646.1 hypothetical protein BDA96_03G426700 [Sorghum bicolor]KXG33957.1 hypothetical protein SORBI_3003G395700 [Sorghum bicolor]|eukprot:XP_002456812.2 uncharacterized protein LOC8056143 [Sorghum bicolor]
MKRGAPPPDPSTAIRTHEAARDEGQSTPRLRDLDGGRRERTRDLEIDGSEMPSRLHYRKMSRKSFEGNDSNVNRLEHYKNVLTKLLLGKGDFFCKGVSNEAQGTSLQSIEGHVCNRALPLFAEQISGLSKNDKEGIKYTLHEIITILNDDLDEIDRDIHGMQECGETCQEDMKKLSAGLLGKLGKMAQGVDDLLNTAASKCRPMSKEEKIELGKRIRKLPEEALNRVVEIITGRKLASQKSDKITMKLGELDDATLWRLYNHVEYVLKENKI